MEKMGNDSISVRRLPLRLEADASLTITRLFWAGPDRARRLVDRVTTLDDAAVSRLLASTIADFRHRHSDLEDVLFMHFEHAARRIPMPSSLTPERKLLIGAYFTLEYAFASAALFNPSITPAVDQSGVAPGSLRFAMSLRAIGEGHRSSIVFRRGIVDEAGNIMIEPVGLHHEPVRRVEGCQFSKAKFRLKLGDSGAGDFVSEEILARLHDPFTLQELLQCVDRMQVQAANGSRNGSAAQNVEWVACCDYEIETVAGGDISQLVLFPVCEAESQGMEDMRLVSFTDEDGSVRYRGTYTAFNGRQTRPQMMEMPRPDLARIRAIQGRCAQNKGLALFPRKVQGRYMMSGRIDGENLYLLKSDDLYVWNEAEKIQEPHAPWEYVQIGNCGSPIETEAGWLLLTHGVGPMRRYCIGAVLLDLDDPTRLIGRLSDPLIEPVSEERSGYVPNVVYSCGALVHRDLLVIPYGISDAATGFATVPLDDLLARLT